MQHEFRSRFTKMHSVEQLRKFCSLTCFGLVVFNPIPIMKISCSFPKQRWFLVPSTAGKILITHNYSTEAHFNKSEQSLQAFS